MHEAILRNFLLGTTDAITLRSDLAGTVMHTSRDVLCQHIVPMATEFEVTPTHLIRLCEAVFAGVVAPADLTVIAFCLLASDRFHWDADTPEGKLLDETLNDWDSPEINFVLNSQTVAKFRHLLLTGESIFTPEDRAKQN
ncbi:MAG TPA: hypothetical protein PLB55_08390 [Prosthecobacter sp.]|jgi:hypothetical protein|nr:hypothetical protein [Prosthecobacter sp.]